MKIAYLDCMSGISGDMTLGALVDAGIDVQRLQVGIDSLGLPSCQLQVNEVRKKGFRATKVDVLYEPEHAHRHLHHITEMIDRSCLTQRQKDLAKQIFTRLGQAEAHVHGTSIDKVHFHEVGAVDSIADIVGSAIGLDLLGVDHVVCSPIPTGNGHVKIAHGRVSIPAPATAELLKGVPLADLDIASELTTPTGAAIASTVASQFGPLPAMEIETIAYGAGTRDLDQQANILRLIVGQTISTGNTGSETTDRIVVMETNLDDISGELIGYTMEALLEAGALDVYTTAIGMKKNRPATKLTVLCSADDVTAMEGIVFQETATLGIRKWTADRSKQVRRSEQVATPWGNIDVKIATGENGQVMCAPEYESCRNVAKQHGVPLRQVYVTARQAFRPSEEG